MSQPRCKGDGDKLDIPSETAHLLSKLQESNKSQSTETFYNLVI